MTDNNYFEQRDIEEKMSTPPMAFYIPSPVLIFSTICSNDETNLSTMSAAGVVCLDPPLISAGIKPSRLTYKNIRKTQKFVINIPLKEHLKGADFVGTRKMRASPNKVKESGFHIDYMPRSKLPYIRECPVVIGCEVTSILTGHELGVTKPSHHCVIARAVECLVNKQWIQDDEVKLEEMGLPIYLNRYYSSIGENLGVQRFTDKMDKRLEKLKEYRSLSYNSEKRSDNG